MKTPMHKPVLLIALLLVLSMTKISFAESFFGEHAKGWHWYEVLPESDKKEEAITDKENQKNLKTPIEFVKAYREVLESRLHAAWVNPTPQNVKSYQEMQKDLMDRSQLFASVWMQNVFQNPELDYTLISPVNQQGRHLEIDLEKERTARTIQNLSQEYGLFFFFSGDCPYCHQFAPIVKRFAETYGWEVIAISVDGGALAEFPNVQANNGLFEAWELKVLPSLLAVNPKTQEAIPIAYGLTSLDEMENRIMTLVSSTPVSPTPIGGKP